MSEPMIDPIALVNEVYPTEDLMCAAIEKIMAEAGGGDDLSNRDIFERLVEAAVDEQAATLLEMGLIENIGTEDDPVYKLSTVKLN